MIDHYIKERKLVGRAQPDFIVVAFDWAQVSEYLD